MTSGAGLMYAGIAIVWAAVLIPMWLRGHDSTEGSRSAERFGQAMRVLSRRPDSEDSDEDHLNRTEVPPQPTRSSTEAHITERRTSNRSGKRRASLARRRARTLAVVAGATLLLAVLAVAGVLPLWAPLPGVTLLVAFVVHLRNQALRSNALRARRASPQARPAQLGDAPTTDPSPEGAPAEVEQPRRRSQFVSGPSRAMVVETKRVGGELEDEVWRPNPLPLPTYVTAPKAVRPIKVIDLTTPGAWSSGHLIDDETAAVEDLLAAELAADELDLLLEHEAKGPADADPDRRAVGD